MPADPPPPPPASSSLRPRPRSRSPLRAARGRRRPRRSDAHAEFLAYATAASGAGEGLRRRHGRRSDDRRGTGDRRTPQRVRRDDGRRRRQRPGEARDVRRRRDREPAGRARQRRDLAAGADRVGAGVWGEWGWDDGGGVLPALERAASTEQRSSTSRSQGSTRPPDPSSPISRTSSRDMQRLNRGMNVVAGGGQQRRRSATRRGSPKVSPSGAHDSVGALCAFSSRGPELDISALGCGVTCPWPGGSGWRRAPHSRRPS